jgi:hypothetical protein
METVYYETIKIETICKNGSEKLGVNAVTNMSLNRDGRRKMELKQFGKTKKEAEDKLLDSLTKDSECIGSFESK